MPFQTLAERSRDTAAVLMHSFCEGLEHSVIASEIVRLLTVGQSDILGAKWRARLRTGMGSPCIASKAQYHAPMTTKSAVAFATLSAIRQLYTDLYQSDKYSLVFQCRNRIRLAQLFGREAPNGLVRGPNWLAFRASAQSKCDVGRLAGYPLLALAHDERLQEGRGKVGLGPL